MPFELAIYDLLSLEKARAHSAIRKMLNLMHSALLLEPLNDTFSEEFAKMLIRYFQFAKEYLSIDVLSLIPSSLGHLVNQPFVLTPNEIREISAFYEDLKQYGSLPNIVDNHSLFERSISLAHRLITVNP